MQCVTRSDMHIVLLKPMSRSELHELTDRAWCGIDTFRYLLGTTDHEWTGGQDKARQLLIHVLFEPSIQD